MLVGLTNTVGSIVYFNTDYIKTVFEGNDADVTVIEMSDGCLTYVKGSINTVIIELQGE